MRINVREDRLLVVSDVHLGNRLIRARRPFMDFLHFAIDNDYSICLNGDGVDIVQMSLQKLTGDLTPVLGLFSRLGRRGLRIYYTVGNHDIQLEHFLEDMGIMRVVPFLNVHSGTRRIRVEHGHTYDRMFLKYPRFYTLFMYIGRLAIAVSPEFYDRLHTLNHAIISGVEYLQSGFKSRAARLKDIGYDAIEGERECFHEGAENVGIRGFDAVIFGHTHLPGTVPLSHGARYYNTGGWFTSPYCVAIDHGETWFGPVSELVAKGDPFPRETPSIESELVPV